MTCDSEVILVPVEPQPKHRLVEGLAHVTHGMDPADDGAVWYDADGINPGEEVRCRYGKPGDIIQFSGLKPRYRIIGVKAEQMGDGFWCWAIECHPT
jgi:hypothetical protein